MVLAAGLACASSFAGTVDDAGAQARNRIMLEQFRQFQLARQAQGGAYVPKALDSRGLPLQQRPVTKAPVLLQLPTVDSQFESLVKRTYQQLLLAPSTCCICSTGANCTDNLFCNGTETCQSGHCIAGTPPCVDGDPCTTDVCTENTDTCSHAAVPPPAAVATLTLGRSAPASPVATLAWSSVSGASAYNIYRGAVAGLSDLACFATGNASTSRNDDGAVPVHAFFYLVTATACGESGLGPGQPNPRRSPPGCP